MPFPITPDNDRGVRNFTLAAEGVCFECGGRLEPQGDGWSLCSCGRWSRIVNRTWTERVPVGPLAGKKGVTGGPCRLIYRDGRIVAQAEGTFSVPVDVTHWEWDMELVT